MSTTVELYSGRRLQGDVINRLKSIDLAGYLRSEGVVVKKNLCRCISPNHEDRKPSMSVYSREGEWRFKCFSCDAKGTIIDACKFLRNLDDGGAIKHLASRYGLASRPGLQVRSKPRLQSESSPESKESKESKELKPSQSLLRGFLNVLAKRGDWLEDGFAFLKRRGFSDDIAKRFFGEFGARVLPKSLSSQRQLAGEFGLDLLAYKKHRLVVPMVVGGEVATLQYRNMDDASQPKTLNLKGFLMAPFNLDGALKPLSEGGDRLYITEGVLDALAFEELEGLPAVGLPSASSIPKLFVDAVRENKVEKVVVVGDDDPAGRQMAPKLNEAFDGATRVLDYPIGAYAKRFGVVVSSKGFDINDLLVELKGSRG